jgi:hypothetical protein
MVLAADQIRLRLWQTPRGTARLPRAWDCISIPRLHPRLPLNRRLLPVRHSFPLKPNPNAQIRTPEFGSRTVHSLIVPAGFQKSA